MTTITLQINHKYIVTNIDTLKTSIVIIRQCNNIRNWFNISGDRDGTRRYISNHIITELFLN